MNGSVWKPWLVPGGILLAAALAFVYSPLLPWAAPSLGFFYLAVFAAGLALAWRFNSSRVLFSLLTILLSHRAVDFFALGNARTGPGRMAVLLCGVLIPLNYAVFAAMRERGLSIAGVAPRFGVLFLESVVVAVACRPENSPNPKVAPAAALPWWISAVFLAGAIYLAVRFFQNHRPLETGFLWSLAAVYAWLNFSPLGRVADAYIATSGLIVVASLIETSYVLAYHDELTGIRGRRAFNETLLALDEQYVIAIVDIDHFKQFNDTYGHDTGDQVLRLVASRLAEVGGGGQAFRCGGEEFAIVFRNSSAKDAYEYLERLRQTIQHSAFRVRGTERRKETRTGESDRRKPGRRKNPASIERPPSDLSVTVSIGVAEPSTRYRQPEQVINAADQALYRAKHNGRNRVELASTVPLKVTRKKRASSG